MPFHLRFYSRLSLKFYGFIQTFIMASGVLEPTYLLEVSFALAHIAKLTIKIFRPIRKILNLIDYNNPLWLSVSSRF